MLKIFLFLLFLFAVVVRTELTLERIDAITDLSSIAKKFFSEEPNLKYEKPNAKMINAFAWSVSEMWDENESALYVLTRLAKLVDEKNSNGELTIPARVIRSFAEKSEARKVYITTAESSSVAFITSSSFDGVTKEEEEIEGLYTARNEAEADFRVVQMIEKRWNNVDQAIDDIETAAINGHFNLMTALIKLGSNQDTLKFIAPELKAGLIIKLLSLPIAQLRPTTAKWLFTMDTYREDQLKLVKTIEKALKKRSEMGQEKTTQRYKNNLMEVFGEVQTIESRKNIVELRTDYFSGIASIDVDTLSSDFYKKTKPQRNFRSQKIVKSLKPQKLEKASKLYEPEKELKDQVEDEEQPIVEQEKKAESDQTSHTASSSSKDSPKEERNYFEDMEEREREIEKAVYETNDDPLYDNDGEYDDNEKKRDRAAQIVVIAIVGSIIATAVGAYIYLRTRRAHRNRTMLVVTEALETVA